MIMKLKKKHSRAYLTIEIIESVSLFELFRVVELDRKFLSVRVCFCLLIFASVRLFSFENLVMNRSTSPKIYQFPCNP